MPISLLHRRVDEPQGQGWMSAENFSPLGIFFFALHFFYLKHTHHVKMQLGTRTQYSLSPTLCFLLSYLKGTHVTELSHAKTSLISVGQRLGRVQVIP